MIAKSHIVLQAFLLDVRHVSWK